MFMLFLFFYSAHLKSVIINDVDSNLSHILKDKLDQHDFHKTPRQFANEDDVEIINVSGSKAPSLKNMLMGNRKGSKRYKPLNSLSLPPSYSNTTPYKASQDPIHTAIGEPVETCDDENCPGLTPHIKRHASLSDIYSSYNETPPIPERGQEKQQREKLSQHLNDLDKVLSDLDEKINGKKIEYNHVVDKINNENDTVNKNLNIIQNVEKNKAETSHEIEDAVASGRVIGNEIAGEEQKLDSLKTQRDRNGQEKKLLGTMMKDLDDKEKKLLGESRKIGPVLKDLEKERQYLKDDIQELEDKKKEVQDDKNNCSKKLNNGSYDRTLDHFY